MQEHLTFVIKEDLKGYNPNQLQISYHPCRILIIGSSKSEKTNASRNLINPKLYTNKVYFYTKDLYEAKYNFLISKCKGAGLKYCRDSKTFIKY